MRSASAGDLVIPRTIISFADRAFASAGPRAWNSLPSNIISADPVSSFNDNLKRICLLNATDSYKQLTLFLSNRPCDSFLSTAIYKLSFLYLYCIVFILYRRCIIYIYIYIYIGLLPNMKLIRLHNIEYSIPILNANQFSATTKGQLVFSNITLVY